MDDGSINHITVVPHEMFERLMRDDDDQPTPGLRAMVAAARLRDAVAQEVEHHGGLAQALKAADAEGRD